MNRQLRPYLLALTLALLACSVPAYLAGIAVALRPLLVQAGLAALLGLLLVVYARLKRAPALQLCLEASLWSVALSSTFNFPMHLLLHARGVSSDAALANADAFLGIDVPALVSWTRTHPRLWVASSWVYDSLHVVSVAAVMLPALARRGAWLSELLLALGLSAIASLAVLSCLRAVGPWVGGAFPASAAQVHCESALRALAAGSATSIDLSRTSPFIAIPSWHVILAVLSACTLGRFRGAALPVTAWAVLIGISTLATGWHYGVDVLAGVAVAGLALGASKYVHRAWVNSEDTVRERICEARVGLASSTPSSNEN